MEVEGSEIEDVFWGVGIGTSVLPVFILLGHIFLYCLPQQPNKQQWTESYKTVGSNRSFLFIIYLRILVTIIGS